MASMAVVKNNNNTLSTQEVSGRPSERRLKSEKKKKNVTAAQIRPHIQVPIGHRFLPLDLYDFVE